MLAHCLNRFDFLKDDRIRRIVELIAVIWLLAAADLMFTIWAHQFTDFVEVNPLVRPIIDHGYVLLLTLVKVATTGTSTGIFWYLRRHARAEWGLWVSVLIYVALMVRWYHYTDQVLAVSDGARVMLFPG